MEKLLQSLFLAVFNMSVTASFAILLVLLVRLCIRRLPKALSYGLWGVVLFRLVCPVSFSSVFSFFNAFGKAPGGMEYLPANITSVPLPQTPAASGGGVPAASSLPAATPYASADPIQVLLFVCSAVWALGVLAMLVYCAVSYLRLRRRVGTAVRVSDGSYESPAVASPFVLGILRPRIYLPAGLSGPERRYILEHERTHIRRRDPLVRLVSFLALCVHWFNPLVWLSYRLMTRDMEMSCDERVLNRMGADIRKEYSASLFSLASGRRLPGSPLAFGENSVSARIKNVLGYKKPALWVLAAAVIAVVCVTAGLVSDPKEDASGAASSAPAVMVDGTVYRLGPNGKTDALPADCEVIGLIKKLASSETPSEDFAAAGLEIGWKVYRGADTGTVYVLDETDGLYYPLDSFDVEAAGKEAMLFTSGDTDLLEIGRAAFEHYYSAFMGENIPEKYRITSFEMTDILLVAGDEKEFCVGITYDYSTTGLYFLSANGSFVPNGSGGDCTDSKQQFRIKSLGNGSYQIVGIGTGGGEQGLVPAAGLEEREQVSKLVADFGGALKMVALLAPADEVKKSITENYSPYVTPELLERYLADPEQAPGRATSSPWPERIDVLKLERTAEGEYTVSGEVVGVTSVEMTRGGAAYLRPVTLTVVRTGDGWRIADTAFGELQSGGASLTPTEAAWSPDQTVGVDMAELDYASDDYVIFHGYFGLFVYDLNALKLVRSLDLASIGCGATQGDDYCDVTVSADGNTVQLHPMSSKNMYVYTVSEGTLRETAYEPMSDRFDSFVGIEKLFPLSEIGKHSHSAVKFDDGDYGFLHVYDWTLGTLSYVRYDMLYALFPAEE